MCNVHPFEVPCDECGETIVVTNASINVVGTYCSGCFGYRMCACNERHSICGEVVLRLAKSGLGIALLADWLVRPEVEQGTLVPPLENFRTPPAPIYALTPSGRFSSGR